MIVSVPSSAFGEEPVTGASTKPQPRSASAAPIRRASAGAIVDMSTNSVPGAAPCGRAVRRRAAPPRPAAPSTTIVITAAAPSAASRGVAATRPPCSATHASAFSAVRL